MNVLNDMRLWVCLVCVCVCARGWLCLKVVLTVYTKRSPKERASLVDPVKMCCVYQTCSVHKGLFAQGANRATLLPVCALA